MAWAAGIVRVLLLAILVFCAASLRRQLDSASARVDAERQMSERSRRFVLASTAGIDLAGKLVYTELPANTSLLVVFGLRGQSLKADIDHWADVRDELRDRRDIDFIGYCDGIECRQTASRIPGNEALTIISYGEASANQVVASADEGGECLIVDRNFRLLRRAQWRAPGQQPAALAKEIAK